MALRRCKGRGVHGASGVSHIFPLLSSEDPRAAEPRCRSDVDSKASPPPKRKRMEAARGAFHAQLAAVMDSLLAAAVCEIAKIFESSLCEQQAELAHKTDEICVLRGELEKAGRRQRAKGGGVEGSEEVEVASGDREGSSRQQTQAGSGRTAHLLILSRHFIGHVSHILTCTVLDRFYFGGGLAVQNTFAQPLCTTFVQFIVSQAVF